jgi:hypothetical protein
MIRTSMPTPTLQRMRDIRLIKTDVLSETDGKTIALEDFNQR